MFKKTISLLLALVIVATCFFGTGAITAQAAICPACGGTGKGYTCPICGGSGMTQQTYYNYDPITGAPIPSYTYMTCSACGGSGHSICTRCGGSGVVADSSSGSGSSDSGSDDTETTTAYVDMHGVYYYLSGVDDSEDAQCLVDGKKKTKYNVMGSSWFVCWDTSKVIAVKSYTLMTANDTAKHKGRNPKHWALYGSNKRLDKDSKKWKKIHEVKKDKKLKAKNFKSYTFKLKKAAKPYRYYKFVVFDNKGDECTQLAELKLNGKVYNPKKPEIKKAVKKGSTTIAVTWKKQKKVKNYELEYSTSKYFKKSKTIKTIKNKKAIKELKKGKKYYVRVRSYRTVNGIKAYSKWSKSKKVKL